nr:hypothetical protein Iba_chr12cCG14620 [Ipomoea batatas]
MLPTCTRHLATENGDDAWMFRDDGKSNNEVQSRDFKVEAFEEHVTEKMIALQNTVVDLEHLIGETDDRSVKEGN